MRAFAIVMFALAGIAACQRVDSAEQSAAKVASAPAPAAVPSFTPSLSSLTVAPVAAEKSGCSEAAAGEGGGGGCGAAEGGGCTMGAQGCTGGVTEMPAWKPLPANATWTDLRVTGMHCGGCARRIEKQLASVDGVLGVKIDLTTAQVAVATLPGIDARAMVKPSIDKLGYRVE